MVSNDPSAIYNNLSSFMPNINISGNVKLILNTPVMSPLNKQLQKIGCEMRSKTSAVPSIEIIPPSPKSPDRRKSFTELFEKNKMEIDKVLTDTLDMCKLKLRRFSVPCNLDVDSEITSVAFENRRRSMPDISSQFLLKVPTRSKKKRRRRNSLPVFRTSQQQNSCTVDRLVKMQSDENLRMVERIMQSHNSRGEEQTVHEIFISGYGKNADDTLQRNGEINSIRSEKENKILSRLEYQLKICQPEAKKVELNMNYHRNMENSNVPLSIHDIKTSKHCEPINVNTTSTPSFYDVMSTRNCYQSQDLAVIGLNNKSHDDIILDNPSAINRNENGNAYANRCFMNSESSLTQSTYNTNNTGELTYRGNQINNSENEFLFTARHSCTSMGVDLIKTTDGCDQDYVLNENTIQQNQNITSSTLRRILAQQTHQQKQRSSHRRLQQQQERGCQQQQQQQQQQLPQKCCPEKNNSSRLPSTKQL